MYNQIQVHPRIRGEYNRRFYDPNDEVGSPPHPRGIYSLDIRRHLWERFTPASAGNMFESGIETSGGEVHPRIRGEYTKQILIFPHFSPYHASNFI